MLLDCPEQLLSIRGCCSLPSSSLDDSSFTLSSRDFRFVFGLQGSIIIQISFTKVEIHQILTRAIADVESLGLAFRNSRWPWEFMLWLSWKTFHLPMFFQYPTWWVRIASCMAQEACLNLFKSLQATYAIFQDRTWSFHSCLSYSDVWVLHKFCIDDFSNKT